jgi:shikimate kinase
MSFWVIIRGPLGCGKSTISKELAKKINAKYFSIDKILKENNLENDREEGYISKKLYSSE